jgi:hypothetical protein
MEMQRRFAKRKKGKSDPLEKKKKGRPHPERIIEKEQNWKDYLDLNEEEDLDDETLPEDEVEEKDETSEKSESK